MSERADWLAACAAALEFGPRLADALRGGQYGDGGRAAHILMGEDEAIVTEDTVNLLMASLGVADDARGRTMPAVCGLPTSWPFGLCAAEADMAAGPEGE